ncbi:hypothetical protein PN36_14315 [Candidatus Thiomargarita nelsonii]|uniref:Uncharacterized protein n=1 Tax=Candidatus Thiomargarita nelsonii TaxID=1003181 RepID=A0A4E0QQ97_9GAMM|nr:hypothetical protein PN36_14315 [Candidatus Thiomargarita nelsonii]
MVGWASHNDVARRPTHPTIVENGLMYKRVSFAKGTRKKSFSFGLIRSPKLKLWTPSVFDVKIKKRRTKSKTYLMDLT